MHQKSKDRGSMRVIELQKGVLVSLLQTLGELGVRRSGTVRRTFCRSGNPRPPQRICPCLYCNVRRKNFHFVWDYFSVTIMIVTHGPSNPHPYVTELSLGVIFDARKQHRPGFALLLL